MSEPRTRKRSGSVRLALMGAAAGAVLAAPGCGHDVQRNRYASLEDCAADYSAAQCHADYPVGTNSSMYRNGGLQVYGPWYRPGVRDDTSDPGPGRLGRSGGVGFSGSSGAGHAPTAVEAGTRGGFGSRGVSARS